MGVIFFIGIVEEVDKRVSKIKIYDEYKEGLEGLGNYKRILILYWFHKRDDYRNRQTLKVHPKGNAGLPKVGVFATQSPSRPNPIGVTAVELIKIEGNLLYVTGLDAYPGSPILDIKPIAK